jgi:hypothetical protein
VSEVTKKNKRTLFMLEEYYKIESKLQLFDQLGNDGWELISIDPRTASSHIPFTSHSESYTDEVNYWFKRPVNESIG